MKLTNLCEAKENTLSYKTVFVLSLSLVLGCIAVIAQGDTPSTNTQPGSSPTSASTTAEAPATPEQRSNLENRLSNYLSDYKAAQWRYTAAYHTCIFGAAIFSALAALLVKVRVTMFGLRDRTRRENWTATTAAIAALLITISTAGNLQQSWQDNMTRRYAVESLLNLFKADQNLTSNEIEDYGKKLAQITDRNFVKSGN